MALIDTNILVYACDEEHPLCAESKKFLKARVEGADLWQMAWQNIFEFLRAVTHPRASRKTPLFIDEALGVARKLLSAQALQIIHPGPRHFEVFSDIAAHTQRIRGNDVYDARLVAIMLENGVRQIFTADDGFRRFRDIEVINPLR